MAMPLYEQTSELRKRILGDEHPNTLETMQNLAMSYYHFGRRQEAMPLYETDVRVPATYIG